MRGRIGVLTGGGDCPGLNAVLRAVVNSAVLDHGWEVIGFRDGFEGLIHPDKAMPLTQESVRGILPIGGTILGTSNRTNPFNYQDQGDVSGQVAETFRSLRLDALIVIGGDGSLSIAKELMATRGVPVVGVPKTIDRDVAKTDTTFGFDTAVVTATEALDKLHTTAEAHHRVMLLEVMGRNAGWIALYAGVAGGADIILIPEIPYAIDPICQKVHERNQAGRTFSLIVVAEGARCREEELVSEPGLPLGARRYAGAAASVEHRIQECLLNTETRVTVLGHIQRGGSPSPLDRILATQFGVAAVELVAQGRFGHMAAIQGGRMTSVPIAEAVSRLSLVDPEGPLVRAARSLGISFGDR